MTHPIRAANVTLAANVRDHERYKRALSEVSRKRRICRDLAADEFLSPCPLMAEAEFMQDLLRIENGHKLVRTE